MEKGVSAWPLEDRASQNFKESLKVKQKSTGRGGDWSTLSWGMRKVGGGKWKVLEL